MTHSPRSEAKLRLSDTVAAELMRWIASEAHAIGAQLPTEKVLCARFGASRAVIREAISRLKADGVVRTRQGSGAFVAARPGHGSFRLVAADPGLPAADLEHLREAFELRYLIETGAAEFAAQRRDESDLLRMEAALAAMTAALEVGANAAADDDAFHVAVAAASHNAHIERLQTYMGHQLSRSRLPAWSEAGQQAGLAGQAQLEHVALLDAIRRGDPRGARKAAADHLDGAARRLGLSPPLWKGLYDQEQAR